MHWVIASPYVTDPRKAAWLTPYVQRDRHTFSFVPVGSAADWHIRGTRTNVAHDWRRHWNQGSDALSGGRADGGIITVFPQLAAVVGLRKRVLRLRRPIVAYSFNVGRLYRGMKAALSKWALADIDRFVVHSRGEIGQYSRWLGLPPERFHFIPFEKATLPVEHEENRDQPFVLSMGSASRDYATLFEAVKELKIRTVVVAATHATSGLEVPPNVEIRRGLSREQCLVLAQRARISVVPVANDQTASGQVTIVEAMTLGRPLIATQCMGAEDYVQDGRTGLLVEPRSGRAMAEAIDRLWHDEPLRMRLGRAARQYAQENFSNEAVGGRLGEVLDDVAAGARPRENGVPAARGAAFPEP